MKNKKKMLIIALSALVVVIAFAINLTKPKATKDPIREAYVSLNSKTMDNGIDNEPRSSKENNVSADDFHRGYYEQKKKSTQEELEQYEHELSEGRI